MVARDASREHGKLVVRGSEVLDTATPAAFPWLKEASIQHIHLKEALKLVSQMPRQ